MAVIRIGSVFDEYHLSQARQGDRECMAYFASYLSEADNIPENIRTYLVEALRKVADGVPYHKAFHPDSKQGRRMSLETYKRNIEITEAMYYLIASGKASSVVEASEMVELDGVVLEVEAKQKIYRRYIEWVLEDMEERHRMRDDFLE